MEDPRAGYEDISDCPHVNDGTRGMSGNYPSVDIPTPPPRAPLRKIDYYFKPEFPCLSKRYTVAVLTCIGFIISFGMRCNMGMAKLQREHEDTTCRKIDPLTNTTLDCVIPTHKLFNWTIAQESAVDSSFFYGYLITQVPGGFLASIIPANRIFGTAIAASSLLNMLVPEALKHGLAEKDSSVLIIVRIFQGLVEGVTYPACHGIWRHWAPPFERSRLATLALCGSYAGVVIGMLLSGIFIKFISWQFPFYFYGLVGLMWFAAWNWLVFEKPSKHPTISYQELTYIEKSLGQTMTAKVPTLATTPWREFAHSMPVYAIIVANFCRSWNFYLLVLYQAKYFNDSFNLNVAESGLVGSLPHLCMTVIVPSAGLLADNLRKRGILSTTMVRKIFNCGGFGMEAFFFLIVANSDSPYAATVALTFGVAFSGFAISGFNVNHLDIAPQYASILMGVSNGIGTMAGFILPPVVDTITHDHTKKSWQTVFMLAASVHFCGVVFYGTFASGELQPWAEIPQPEQTTMNEFNTSFDRKDPPGVRRLKYGSVGRCQVSEDREQYQQKTGFSDWGDDEKETGTPVTNPFKVANDVPSNNENPFN